MRLGGGGQTPGCYLLDTLIILVGKADLWGGGRVEDRLTWSLAWKLCWKYVSGGDLDGAAVEDREGDGGDAALLAVALPLLLGRRVQRADAAQP